VDGFRAQHADQLFCRVTEYHDDGSVTVTKFNGGEIIVEPAEARRIAKLQPGDLVELEFRHYANEQRSMATRVRPLGTEFVPAARR
jgi:translation initiation factor IF-1